MDIINMVISRVEKGINIKININHPKYRQIRTAIEEKGYLGEVEGDYFIVPFHSANEEMLIDNMGIQEYYKGTWIKTKDRLPEKYTKVPCLVWVDNTIRILCYNHDNDCWDDEDGDDIYCHTQEIEYWMPLPEGPKE